MLPNRQVIPFSDFFTASLSVKDVIKEIIVREGRPLTDREIVTRCATRASAWPAAPSPSTAASWASCPARCAEREAEAECSVVGVTRPVV